MFVTPMPSDVPSDSMPSSPESLPCTGLSALIHAATSQLEYLAEVASTQFVKEDDSAEHHQSWDPPPTSEKAPTSPSINDRPASFPEQLMKLCCQPENQNIITFLPHGKFFAVRQSLFQQHCLEKLRSEDINTFSDFVRHLQQWGFRRMDATTDLPEVLVFRHSQFIEGDYVQCRQIVRPGDSVEATPTHPPFQSFHEEHAKVIQHHLIQSKRRLSPGFLHQQEQEYENGSKVQVVVDRSDDTVGNERKVSSGGESETTATTESLNGALSEEPEIRSVASSIAAEKLHLTSPPTESLVDTAVTSCTYEIVTAAIECILRDKTHSQIIYQKHEKELSRSSLPGLVPVCKHMFAGERTDEPTPMVRVVTDGPSTYTPPTTTGDSPDTMESPNTMSHARGEEVPILLQEEV